MVWAVITEYSWVNMWAGLVWSISRSSHNWTQLTDLLTWCCTTCDRTLLPSCVQWQKVTNHQLIFLSVFVSSASTVLVVARLWRKETYLRLRQEYCAARMLAGISNVNTFVFLFHTCRLHYPQCNPTTDWHIYRAVYYPLKPQKVLYFFFHICSSAHGHL